MLALLLSGLTALTACSSSDDDPTSTDDSQYDLLGLTRRASQDVNSGIVVKLFERNGLKLQVVDITDQFESATYDGKRIPVSHVFVEQLPTAIQEKAINAGAALSTRVCRIEYEGEYYYDIYSLLSSTITNIFDSNGERCTFNSSDDYWALMNNAKDISCILVLTSQAVKSAEGAPNYLVGYWQTDWQHLTKSGGQQATVALYPDLPFSITEVLSFNDDGTGYLRTVKAYKDGSNEVALDPFSYVLTDYHGGEQYGYQGYYYKCYFAAGDAIEYLVRSYDNMQTLNGSGSIVNYPWFRQTGDAFESLPVNAGQKYRRPGRDEKSPVVGRWKGSFQDTTLGAPYSFTWVFRSDNTGYRLWNDQYDVPFAYTVSYKGDEAELTIYKYNSGFTVNEGFAKSITDLTFDPTILPKGETIKAKVSGNTLEMEGWNTYQRED